jgi:hypothetical protein
LAPEAKAPTTRMAQSRGLAKLRVERMERERP